MSLRKAEFSITAAPAVDPTPGSWPMAYGSDDVVIRPSVPSRGAHLHSVTVDLANCTTLTPSVVIYELLDPVLATGDTSAESYEVGKQIFTVDLLTAASLTQQSSFRGLYEFDPRHPAINALDGTTPTYDALTGVEMIHANAVRCDAYGMHAGDVLVVTMYYETAGDYRF